MRLVGDMEVAIHGWVIEPKLFLPLRPSGLRIERTADTLHVPGRLRRSQDTCWVRDGDRTWVLDVSQLAVVGPAQLFLFPLLVDAPVALPEPGAVDGRPTWVLTVDDHRVEIDQEHGVVVAVQSDSGRVEARDLDFPEVLPDPAWTGEAQRWVFDDGRFPEEKVLFPDALPGEISQLPPAPVSERVLRIHVTTWSLEGAPFDYQVGKTVRLPLGLRTSQPPIAGLETTRRGWIRNLEEGVGQRGWPVILTGDGWAAFAHTPRPQLREAELTGWFAHAPWEAETVVNDLRIVRIFGGVGGQRDPERRWQEVSDTADAWSSDGISLQEVVLEVTLDNVERPPLKNTPFIGGRCHVRDGHLWVCHQYLPVLRCWALSDGKYLGESLVPVPVREAWELAFDADVIAVQSQGWTLEPGAHMLAPAEDWVRAPAAVLPAELAGGAVTSFGDGFYTVFRESGCALARLRDGELSVRELPAEGMNALAVTRIGDRVLVESYGEVLVLDDDLAVLSAERSAVHAPGIPRWQSTDGIAWTTLGRTLRFHVQDTGAQLGELTIPQEFAPEHTRVFVDESEVMVLLQRWIAHRRVPGSVHTLRGGVWSSVPLGH